MGKDQSFSDVWNTFSGASDQFSGHDLESIAIENRKMEIS